MLSKDFCGTTLEGSSVFSESGENFNLKQWTNDAPTQQL